LEVSGAVLGKAAKALSPGLCYFCLTMTFSLETMTHSPSCWPTLLTASVTASLIAFVPPGQALEVTVKPTKPALGDTVSVLIEGDSDQAPVVKFGQQTYPAFQLKPNRWRSLLPTTPLDKPGRRSLQVSAGKDVRNLAVWVAKRSFPTQRLWLPPGKDNEGTDFEFSQTAAFKKLVTPQKLWSGVFRKPNRGPISAIYGIRRYYNGVFAKDYYHRGIDYAGGTGSPVVAPAAGRVALVGRESQGFKIHGNVVGLDHGQGVTSIFLHLSRINVQKGELVKAGQVIGAVGSTGASTGPHLHWGLYIHGLAVDPAPWRVQGFE